MNPIRIKPSFLVSICLMIAGLLTMIAFEGLVIATGRRLSEIGAVPFFVYLLLVAGRILFWSVTNYKSRQRGSHE